MADLPFRLRTCRSVREQLSAFLDDEVDHDDAVDIARHVSGCEECAAELEGIRAARMALRSLPRLRPPEALTPPTEAARPRRNRLTLLGLAAIIVAGLAVFAAGEQTGDVVPPIDDFVVDHVNRTGGDPIMTPVRIDR